MRNKSILIIMLILMSTMAYAILPNPGHLASSVGAGTFSIGDFIFPSNLMINQTLTVNKSVVVVQNVTADNLLGKLNASYIQNPFWLTSSEFTSNNNTIWGKVNELVSSNTSMDLRVDTAEGTIVALGLSNTTQSTAISELLASNSSAASTYVNTVGDSMTGKLAITQTANDYCLHIDSQGTQTAEYIDINAKLANNKAGFWVFSDFIQNNTGTSLVSFTLDDSSTHTANVLEISNAGRGKSISIAQVGNGSALHIDSDSDGYPAISITQTSGGCVVGYYGVYTNSTGHPYWCLNGTGKIITLT